MCLVAAQDTRGYHDIAKEIQGFLWEGEPFKSQRIERTSEELEAFLEVIRVGCWLITDEDVLDACLKK